MFYHVTILLSTSRACLRSASSWPSGASRSTSLPCGARMPRADERAGLTADEVIDAVAVRQLMLKLALDGDGFRQALVSGMTRPAPRAGSKDSPIPARAGPWRRDILCTCTGVA